MITIQNGWEISTVNPSCQWPSMGDEKYCSDCIRWKKHKTANRNDVYDCGLPDSGKRYCKSYGKPYWRSKYKEKEFIEKEEFEF